MRSWNRCPSQTGSGIQPHLKRWERSLGWTSWWALTRKLKLPTIGQQMTFWETWEYSVCSHAIVLNSSPGDTSKEHLITSLLYDKFAISFTLMQQIMHNKHTHTVLLQVPSFEGFTTAGTKRKLWIRSAVQAAAVGRHVPSYLLGPLQPYKGNEYWRGDGQI